MKTLKLHSVVIGLTWLASCGASQAQSPSNMGAPGALELQNERIQTQRREVFAPVTPPSRPSAYPSEAQIDALQPQIAAERKSVFGNGNVATQNPINNFPKIEGPSASQVDIEALAKRYESRAESRGSADDLMAFASFSMPAPSLKALVASVSRAGGSVVLRGFKNNSYKETVAAIAALGEGAASVNVNPNAFEKYKVTSVPAVVLTKLTAVEQLDSQGCALPDSYAAIFGDVALSYALEQIARRAPEFQALANRYLRSMGVRPVGEAGTP